MLMLIALFYAKRNAIAKRFYMRSSEGCAVQKGEVWSSEISFDSILLVILLTCECFQLSWSTIYIPHVEISSS